MRHAFVTGASRGIGRAAASALAAEGLVTWLGFKEREDAARDLASEIARGGGEARPLHVDVASPESCKEAIRTIDSVGPLVAFVHAAGVHEELSMLRGNEAHWRRVVDTNLTSFYSLGVHVARSMMRARGGSVVAIGSVVGRCGLEHSAAYCASKSGLVGLVRSMSRELGRHGIRVNLVSPGWIETDMTRGRPVERVLARIPLSRTGTPEDVAACVRFLCSEGAAYVTGAEIPVAGGLDM
ncbi:oxidoreductase [Sorangium cellulosum]|uniref:Oxidoreductase n=1 Tax=Sorangium cellulosum TaxID=56 RepID=A0A4P2QCN4_SORCE|nr:SDR family NAD(P)-dependent oxidoreductase [Sorangium cellulosum]AUX26883.1 oxidoreductase [Sorangium cellulosum]